MVILGSNSQREIQDIMLTRYACYLIAQNGDPRKETIAFAQTYFAMQTRKLELIKEQIHGLERLQAQQKLTHSEKELSGLIFKHTKSDKNFGLIHSKGDYLLSYLKSSFGNTQIKRYITGATVTCLTKDVVNNLKIPLPPLTKQNKTKLPNISAK